ncbi:LOW QUALITY PROTEIN: protein fantom [Brachionichthys hirsutus]|uniref:LOW QUALITY PROTEIN: protein fantom n=1 Tax=Brachionichthys hirsutus TaxID=412623 RepID=UPI0036050A5C
MSPVVDETAGDLPVRDVGPPRGGLVPTVADTSRDLKQWKKHHVIKTKDPQRLFRFPREQLEDLCLRLQEENCMLRQHTRTQEQKLRRMSTRLMRLRQTHPGSSGVKDRDMEDTIQDLEIRVAKLERQKETLHNKLSLAKQHIMDLGGRTVYKMSKGKTLEAEGGFRRAAQTAPPRFGPMLEDTRAEMERLCVNKTSAAEQVRAAELEMTAQALRDTLRDKEKEMEGTMREIRKQQADKLRINIRENVDLIHLQKQLSEKGTALRVTQEKFNSMREAYENQLEESHRSLRGNQEALLEKVEELTGQLKQERQRALTLEGQLNTSSLSLRTLEKLQERISDVERERDVIKENYDALLESTLSLSVCHGEREVERKREILGEHGGGGGGTDVQGPKERLQWETDERGWQELQKEKEKLSEERGTLEEQRERESEMLRDKQDLEREVLQYREQVSTLQGRLDSISKEFDMSIEELSETLLQIKAFRMQQESRAALSFLSAGERVEDSPRELANVQASHAETVLELQKTRTLLVTEHRISQDLQDELNTVNQMMAREKEEGRRRIAEKDKLLSRRGLQINTLQAQLKELAYSPRNYKRTVPIQYTWPTEDQGLTQTTDDDMPFSQLRAGESLLEIHLKAATFTPTGLRTMAGIRAEDDTVTFCTYSLLDFEVHSTPLASGSRPDYSFTSRYALTARDLGRLGGQGSKVKVELHQALGGVRFVTHGRGQMPLMGAMERRGERIRGHVNITGSEGEMVGVVDFWVRLFGCLFGPAEPTDPAVERRADGKPPMQTSLGWRDDAYEELHDYGAGIPNELLVTMERCVGLSARWPGLIPDAYLTYRLYDLPPRVSQTVQCATDPVFNDTASYPLAVTADALRYLRSSSLWVYLFDDSDDQVPPAYLAKTPIPLQALSAGREIRGDYVLRDPSGAPRGMVRVMMKWKYPFQPSVGAVLGQEGRRDSATESPEKEERRKERAEASQRPVAKPRVKSHPQEKQESSQNLQPEQRSTFAPRKSTDGKTSTKRSSDLRQQTRHLAHEARRRAPAHHQTRKPSEGTSPRHSPATLSQRSSSSEARTQDLPSVNLVSGDEEEEEKKEMSESAAATDRASSDSSSAESDVIISPPKRKLRKGDKLRVEILSLTLEPSSRVALDKSVQCVYVVYRLLGVPMETTETPVSLRKPTKGEEIHYNFTRVIYVDGSHSAPLRHYLYTMLEGSDPNQGRLKFTVVSEPIDDDEECLDVGYAFLDLHELLLTGDDVTEQQIDILSVDEDMEVVGNLKVSLEAAKALAGIYREFHKKSETKIDEKMDEEEEELEKKEELQEEDKNKDLLQMTDYDDDDF